MRGRREKIKEKNLKGTDIILNLKEINVVDIDSFSSSGCAGRVRFEIECHTEQGYCEDPNFSGRIKILDAKKSKENNTYLLKVRFDQEEDD